MLAQYDDNPIGDNLTPSNVDPSVASNPFLYAGEYQDATTGLYNLRARNYDANTSRFLSPDPLGAQDAASSYAYVGDNPLGYIDPSGMKRTNPKPKVTPMPDDCVTVGWGRGGPRKICPTTPPRRPVCGASALCWIMDGGPFTNPPQLPDLCSHETAVIVVGAVGAGALHATFIAAGPFTFGGSMLFLAGADWLGATSAVGIKCALQDGP